MDPKNCSPVTYYSELHRHLKQEHNIECKAQKKQFPSVDAFVSWRKDLEQSTGTRFAIFGGMKKRGVLMKTWKYKCHRAGNARILAPEQRKRGYRQRAEAAVGVCCPALLDVAQHEGGQVSVAAYLDHLGHDHVRCGISTPDHAVQRFSPKLVNLVIEMLKDGCGAQQIVSKVQKGKGMYRVIIFNCHMEKCT